MRTMEDPKHLISNSLDLGVWREHEPLIEVCRAICLTASGRTALTRGV